VTAEAVGVLKSHQGSVHQTYHYEAGYMSKTVFPQTVKPWVDEYEAKNDYLILDRSGVSIYVPVLGLVGCSSVLVLLVLLYYGNIKIYH
jgi:hypothetical protein